MEEIVRCLDHLRGAEDQITLTHVIASHATVQYIIVPSLFSSLQDITIFMIIIAHGIALGILHLKNNNSLHTLYTATVK